jgi:hypothetical protein
MLDVEEMAADTSSSFETPLADQEGSPNQEEEEEEEDPRVQPPKRSAETNTNDDSIKRQRLIPAARKGWLQAILLKDKTRHAHPNEAMEPCQVVVTDHGQGLAPRRDADFAKKRHCQTRASGLGLAVGPA